VRRIIIMLTLCLFSQFAYAKEVKITFLQLNDVYEIAPVNGGTLGGLARVSTLLQQLKQQNPHTYSVMAGDFLSPSAMGTAKIDGTPLAGKQMVDVLNQMGWDFATFGNHEFDIGRDSLLTRLKESKFTMVSNNVTDIKTGKPFINSRQSIILDADGVKVALVGITLAGSGNNVAAIADPLKTAAAEVRRLREKKQADIIILVTHLAFVTDVELAENIPGVDLIMGGHEHENMRLFRGAIHTPITKADADARSAYIHYLNYDTKTKKLKLDSVFTPIDSSISPDPKIEERIAIWQDQVMEAFKKEGHDPEKIIANSTEALDGLESSVRNHSTRLTEILADSALHSFKDAEVSLVNSGAIRVDDIIPSGTTIRNYDVLKILPFGGTISKVSMPGDILQQALDIGLKNQGTGAFLHHSNIVQGKDGWVVSGKPLDTGKNYIVAVFTYLITKGDKGLGLLSNNPRIKLLEDTPIDTRTALADELGRVYPVK
jgi:5'-nucleotidase/UDP-sugar diphosphatase